MGFSGFFVGMLVILFICYVMIGVALSSEHCIPIIIITTVGAIIAVFLLISARYNAIPIRTVRVCNEDGVTLKTYSEKGMGISLSDNVITFVYGGKTLAFTVDSYTNNNNTDYTVDISDSIAKSLGLDLTVDGLAQ